MATSKPAAAKPGKALTLQDLSVVLTELFPVRAKWYNIGLELAVSVVDLQRIESEYKNDHSTCLRQMLIRWLEKGSAYWTSLCEALQRPIVLGEDTSLATSLKEKYCGGGGPEDSGEAAKGKKRKTATVACGQAAAAKKPKSGGAIPENLNPEDFKRPPAQDRLCAKCKTVPHNPQRSECCNELYCFTCSLEDLICLTHRQRIVFAADKKFKTNMAKWNIKCPNWRTGCTFEDTISKVYKQHLPECTGGPPTPTASGNSTTAAGAGASMPSKPTPAKPPTPTKPLTPTITTTTVKPETVQPKAQATSGKICCIYAQQGCTWRGDLGSLSKHIMECKISSGGAAAAEEKKAPPTTSKKAPPTTVKSAAKSAHTKLAAQSSIKKESKPVVKVGAPMKAMAPAQLQPSVSAAPATGSTLGAAVHCVYLAKGCTWTGSLEQLAIHMQECPKGPAGPRANVANVSQGRAIPQGQATIIKEESETQQQRVKIETAGQPSPMFGHLVRNQLRSTTTPVTSSLTPVPCRYHQVIGCPYTVPPDQMNTHLQSNVQSHLDLAIEMIGTLQTVLEGLQRRPNN